MAICACYKVGSEKIFSAFNHTKPLTLSIFFHNQLTTMAKALVDIGEEWPFDHDKPGAEDLYHEVVTRGKFENIGNSDVCLV